MASEYNNLLITLLIIAGFGGVTINAFFLFLNLSRWEFRKDYFLFLCTTSFLNFVHSWVILVFHPIVVALDIRGDSVFCKTLSYIHIISGVGGISIQSLLSFNRFISLYYPQKMKILFDRNKIFLMMSSVMLIPVTCGLLLWIFDEYGRPMDTICCPKINTMPVAHMLFVFGPMMISYQISAFFTYKIFRLIKNHQNLSVPLGSKLQEAKDIVRLIVIEITIPICMESPAVLMSFIASIVNIPIPMMDVALFFFVLHSSTDPLVAMIVIKPYRRAINILWNKIKWKPKVEPRIFTISTGPRSSRSK